MLSLLLGGGYLLYQRFVIAPQQAATAQTKTASPETVTIPITVTANGTVQPEAQTNVSPKNSGRLQEVTVEEGDTVQAGQVLAYMDDSDLKGQLIQAQGQVEAAQANVDQLVAGNLPQQIGEAEATLASARAQLTQATGDLARYQNLYNEGAIAAIDLSTFQTAQDTAQAAVDNAQKGLELVQIGSRPEAIAQARGQLLQSQGILTAAQTQIENTIIRAPFYGTVTARYAEPGDFVAPTTAASATSSSSSSSILSLASNYQVVANVAETDIAKIKVGQLVSVRADAYPTERFDGSVAQIAEQATVTSNVTSFEVRVNLPAAAQEQLKPGMNTNAIFQAGELTNVMVVPTVAIVRQTQGEGVLVLDADNQPQFQPVETGLSVDDKTQIVSGLRDGDQVVLSAAQGLPENVRSIGPGRGGRESDRGGDRSRGGNGG